MARKPRTGARSAPPPAALPLPPELTIYTVGELHPQWLAWLAAAPADAPQATVNAAAVDQVDAAGLQMLLSLQRALEARGQRMGVEGASPALRDGCAAIGLGDWLQAHDTERGVHA